VQVGTCGIGLDGERAGAGHVGAEGEIVAGERKVIGAAGDGRGEVGGCRAGIDGGVSAQRCGAVEGDVLVRGGDVDIERRRPGEGECPCARLCARHRDVARAAGDEGYRISPGGIAADIHRAGVGRIADDDFADAGVDAADDAAVDIKRVAVIGHADGG